MNFQYKIVSPWKQLLLLLLILSPQLIAVLSSTFSSEQIGGIDFSSKEMINKAKWLQVFSSTTFFIIPALIFAVFVVHYKHLQFLGFRKVENPVFLPLSVIIIIVSAPLVFWLGQMNELIPLPPRLQEMELATREHVKNFLVVDNFGDILFNLFVLALIPAISEEILFRGALQNTLIRLTKNPWAGILIASIIFSAMHLQFAGFFPRLFLGILLGLFYYLGGSLWVPIFAHFIYNAIQVVIAGLNPDLGNENPSVPIIAALISAALVVYLIKVFKSKSSVHLNSKPNEIDNGA